MSRPALSPPPLAVHRLPSLGRGLVADVDAPLAALGPGALLLLHVPPGVYPWERHGAPEYVVCLHGHVHLEDDQGLAVRAAAGEMVEVLSGVRHRFAEDSDAVLLVVTQRPSS